MTLISDKTPHSGLIRNLKTLLVILLTLTLASAGAVLYRDRQNREAVAAAQITRVAEQMASRLDRFFGPVTEDLLLIRQWSLNGSLSVTAPEILVAKLSPLMQNHSQIYAFSLWRHGRLAFMLVRDGEALLMGAAEKNADQSSWVWQSKKPGGPVTEQWVESATADGGALGRWRNAPEFLEAEQVVWHRTESLPPAGWTGLFAATGWNAENASYVGAASVLDTQIAQLLDNIRSGPSYRFFLFSDNGLFIDFQNSSSPPQELLVTTGDAISSQDSKLAAARQAWQQNGETGEPFGFTYAGDRLYGLTHTLKGAHQQTGIGVIAAKDDLLRHLPLNRFFFVPAVLGLLWVALLAVALRTRTLSRQGPGQKPLHHVTETELLRLINQGETDTLEFKSTLRWNLKSGKAGKEIELACLKTIAAFMNSDGGTLLVGVADDGTVTGITADNFPNDDKYLRHFSAIFEQHIGLNFSEFVEFALLPAKGEQVFVVRCQRSPRPVFMTHKKDEMFFIRSGPSSRQLTTSQVLTYLDERGSENSS
ncbi:MAG: ATP-binding protein [Desulfosarcina sp.]|nr:ATP-binding protein [Desulfosarcina sp.]MBC2742732.1 ATP-binding protein [Desulfosarcina sp.]MBC2765642.1 ATP-binding protein [Desulfosarcina sp.]